MGGPKDKVETPPDEPSLFVPEPTKAEALRAAIDAAQTRAEAKVREAAEEAEAQAKAVQPAFDAILRGQGVRIIGPKS